MNSSPEAAPLPKQRSGCGCFASGCVTVFVVGFVLLLATSIGGWLYLKHSVKTLTSPEPSAIQLAQPVPQQIEDANAKFAGLRQAIATGQETRVEFTADDINALIASDPALKDLRGHTRVTIANSLLTIDISTKIPDVPWDELRGRWFNGRLQFGVSYLNAEFNVALKSVETPTGGVPHWILSTAFGKSFNDWMNERIQRKAGRSDVLAHLSSVAVQDDKLIITTRATR